MSRRVAILGLGDRGSRWADAFHTSGWLVSGFDPDAAAGRQLAGHADVRREQTISATVHGANWVFCCLPERLELMQMVLQRAQAEAPRDALIAVTSRDHDVEDIQNCVLRPPEVVRIVETEDGTLALDVTERNPSAVRAEAQQVLAELAAMLSLEPAVFEDSQGLDLGAESA